MLTKGERKELVMLSPAARKYKKTSFAVLGSYFALFFAADYVAFRMHPEGAGLWMLAALPALPIVAIIALTGKYLREEKDEYKRNLAVRCLLWGTAGLVATNMLFGFARIFGWKGQPFPFTEFFVFAVLMVAAKVSYRAANRVPADE